MTLDEGIESKEALMRAGLMKDDPPAGYENRLTRLTTLVQAMLAIGMLLLASQGAIWLEIRHLGGKIDQIGGKVDQIGAKLDRITPQ
jgi:hypothetical protein